MAGLILYSFRRCPYAIRARLALRQAGITPELREVDLRCKPPELIAASAKATVPVLVRPDGPPIDESLELMRWALAQNDPHGLLELAASDDAKELLLQNDGPFKHHLDRYRYPRRYGGSDGDAHRRQALAILREWNERLQPQGWLLGSAPSLVDLALLPFVRQFRHSDPAGFEAEPGLQPLQGWLDQFLSSPELAAVLEPPWAARQRWRSPQWLYHLALPHEWQQARQKGSYHRSTRGRSLQEEGFIHLSGAHQLEATHGRFYADLDHVVLLTVDPHKLPSDQLKWEAIPTGEQFPHLYGPLPLDAVLSADRYRAEP